jgi:hypothetical protein
MKIPYEPIPHEKLVIVVMGAVTIGIIVGLAIASIMVLS